MHYDAVIIGAGMSGLAAGIRLAYFDKRVLIVERHYAYGGLNSYYRLNGFDFDVGLHAVTNYVSPGAASAPLPKLLRQLRLTREALDLKPQRFSEIRFPGRTLRFTNDIAVLTEEVAEQFPDDADNFVRLLRFIEAYDDLRPDAEPTSTRKMLGDALRDPLLIDMLLCPLMYYGSATEHDMDLTQFATMFKAIFLQGMARPPGGVRHVIRTLVKRYRACGGRLRMNCGVQRIEIKGDRVAGLHLSTGETITADVVLSSAGWYETMRLLAPDAPVGGPPEEEGVGRISFVECIGVLDEPPARHGHEATLVFFSDAVPLQYAVPDELVDLRSGVVCCPNNYEDHDAMKNGVLRITWLANPRAWSALDQAAYADAKQAYHQRFVEAAGRYVPDFADRLLHADMFTPKTIQRFTGHLNGAVYGARHKARDGRTGVEGLFVCGTDQGFLGIIGAMLSGITMANNHVLARD